MADGTMSLLKSNWNKYDDAVREVAQKEVCRVLLWLYKGGTVYVGDFLKNRKYLTKEDKDQLSQRESPTNMDITLLYRLIQQTCGLSPDDDRIWNNPQPSDALSLEHTLYLIKEERNKLAHESQKKKSKEMSDDELTQKLETVRTLCSRMLCEAARLSARHDQLTDCIDKMENQLRRIRGVTYENFTAMARKEREALLAWREDNWYVPPLMTHDGETMSLEGLLEWRAADNKVPDLILVSGEQGVGKSSLCRYLEESWVRPTDDMRTLQYYELVLRMNCWDVSTSDRVRLLQDELLQGTVSWFCPLTLLDYLRTMKTLWVLDGLEEATPEATRLLSSLLRSQPKEHTILVTSRPEHSQQLLRECSSLQKIHLTINLCGADPLKTLENLEKSNATGKTAKQRIKNFIKDFKELETEIRRELQNPLTLHLAMEDWEKTVRSTFHQEFDLGQLYLKVTDAQKRSLVSKLTEGPITERELSRKVEKWFLFLCTVAFELIRDKKVPENYLPKKSLKKLEDKCDDLKISSSKCLSTFLPYQNDAYTFHHNTQVYFLAAFHLTSKIENMENADDLLSKMCSLLNIPNVRGNAASESQLEHFYEVLFFLLSIKGSSASNTVLEMLVTLLSYAIPKSHANSHWFQVVRKGAYEQGLLKEVSKVVPESWIISDCYVEAAMRLLVHRQPRHVELCLEKNPKKLPHLVPLLQSIARLPVEVELCLGYCFRKVSSYSTVDKYIAILCQEDSKCVLLRFEGHLGEQGYSLLKQPTVSDCCTALKLKIKSVSSLERLCECVEGFEFLDSLELTLAVRELSFTLARLPSCDVVLQLPYIKDETARETALFVARLSRSYESFAVSNLTHIGAQTFVKCLQKKNVRANHLLRPYVNPRNGSGSNGCIDYGPLPLSYPLEKLMWYWVDVQVLLGDEGTHKMQ